MNKEKMSLSYKTTALKTVSENVHQQIGSSCLNYAVATSIRSCHTWIK